jgi:hypothetical protein
MSQMDWARQARETAAVLRQIQFGGPIDMPEDEIVAIERAIELLEDQAARIEGQ